MPQNSSQTAQRAGTLPTARHTARLPRRPLTPRDLLYSLERRRPVRSRRSLATGGEVVAAFRERAAASRQRLAWPHQRRSGRVVCEPRGCQPEGAVRSCSNRALFSVRGERAACWPAWIHRRSKTGSHRGDVVAAMPHNARMRHQTRSVRRDFYGCRASITHHSQGEPPSSGPRTFRQPKDLSSTGCLRALPPGARSLLHAPG